VQRLPATPFVDQKRNAPRAADRDLDFNQTPRKLRSDLETRVAPAFVSSCSDRARLPFALVNAMRISFHNARRRGKTPRRGTAALEMGIVLPPLVFLALAVVDFGRVYYYTGVITNCARNGAMYASDPLAQAASPYVSITQAALADASNLSPSPTVSSSSGTDASGNAFVAVTVNYTYNTIVNYPGIPATSSLSRTVQVRVAPTTPN
jgi:Flp pilus assembly protein TadG